MPLPRGGPCHCRVRSLGSVLPRHAQSLPREAYRRVGSALPPHTSRAAPPSRCRRELARGRSPRPLPLLCISAAYRAERERKEIGKKEKVVGRKETRLSDSSGPHQMWMVCRIDRKFCFVRPTIETTIGLWIQIHYTVQFVILLCCQPNTGLKISNSTTRSQTRNSLNNQSHHKIRNSLSNQSHPYVLGLGEDGRMEARKKPSMVVRWGSPFK